MTSITELTVALGLFMIIMLITTLVLSTLTDTSEVTTKLTNSTENVQLSIAQIEQYIGGAVAPNTAAASSSLAGSASAFPLAGGFPCWGSDQPNSSGGFLPVPETTAILIAHDYDFEFCGYIPGSRPHVPHVIRIYMTTPCSATVDACTVKVIDYTTKNSGFTSCTTSASSCSSTNTYTGSSASTLLTVSNVACDSNCKTSVLGAPHTGALAAATNTANDAIACDDQSSCLGGTPPLFSYYAASGPSAPGNGAASGAMNPSGLPLIDVASNNGTATGSSGCSPPPSPATSDCSSLQTVSSVQLDMTILGNHGPGFTATRSAPSTAVSDLVYLPSLLTGLTTPYAPTGVTATASATAGQASVTWTVPYDGGSDICYFTVTPYIGANSVPSLADNFETAAPSPAIGPTTPSAPCPSTGSLNYTAGSTDTVTIPGLASGQAYSFTVIADNHTAINGNSVGGASTESLPSNTVTVK